MSATEGAVRLLGEISESDRNWILQNLSVTAKARLAEHVEAAKGSAAPSIDAARADRGRRLSANAGTGAGTGSDYEWDRAVAVLAAADPARVTQSLLSEPVWLVNAILHAAEWPWAREFMRNLPAALRAELASQNRQHARLGRPATAFLLSQLAARAEQWPPAPTPHSSLRAWLGRLRRRGGE